MTATRRALPDRRTRLVATIGPASVGRVERLVAAGLDVARVNLSHGTQDDHRRAVEAVRSASDSIGRPVGILVDLPGPKLRLGVLADDPLTLEHGTLVLLGGPMEAEGAADGPVASAASASRPPRLPLSDDAVPARLRAGDRLLLADGAVELRVVTSTGNVVTAEVVRGGTVRTRQGVSTPAERMPVDALGRADETLLPHLLSLGPDFVGQSFVRSAADVQRLRSQLPAHMRIVAKIETRPALEDIQAILAVADGIMVARGDLGVELPFEQVPLAQKDLVRAALAAGRPCIVATQMLESMVHSPRPTRAEVSDVANAILDGADAVMLSGETAVGEWPEEALRAAAGICKATDAHLVPTRPPDGLPSFGSDRDAKALAVAAVAMADADADVVALACYTHSGRTPRRLASLRPSVPIVAFTPTQARARSLTLERGVHPVVLEVTPDDPVSIARAVVAALRVGVEGREVEPDAAVVLVQTSVRGGPNALELLRL
jgi:pyruvate kinase